jgi:hypothetical protein
LRVLVTVGTLIEVSFAIWATVATMTLRFFDDCSIKYTTNFTLFELSTSTSPKLLEIQSFWKFLSDELTVTTLAVNSSPVSVLIKLIVPPIFALKLFFVLKLIPSLPTF